jgi:oligopeptide/dipeptide ABC transporter ATP-binding protein
MYLGRILELSDWKTIYENPLHPYTRILLSAVPIPDPNVEKRRNIEEIKGDVPSASNMPSGCSFHPRCPFAAAACASKVPVLREMYKGHYVACHIADAWNGKRSCN